MNLYSLLNLFLLLFLCLNLIPFIMIFFLMPHLCLLLILFTILLLSQTPQHLLILLFLKNILLIFLRICLFLFLMTLLLLLLILLIILCLLFMSLSLSMLLLPLQLVLFFVILSIGGLLEFLDHLLTFNNINAMLLPPNTLLPIIFLVTNSLLLTPIFVIVSLPIRNHSFTIK